MKKIVAIIVLCISAFGLKAQYKKGYVVTLNNDTLKGHVKLPKNFSSDDEIKFKTDTITAIYNAYQIKSFKCFLSKYISKKKGTDQIVFMNQTIKGKVSLYILINFSKEITYRTIYTEFGKQQVPYIKTVYETENYLEKNKLFEKVQTEKGKFNLQMIRYFGDEEQVLDNIKAKYFYNSFHIAEIVKSYNHFKKEKEKLEQLFEEE